MPTIREIQDSINRLHKAGVMDSDEVLRKLFAEFGGDVPTQDIAKAFEALADELDIRAAEEMEEARAAERCLAMIERAQQESGQTGMNTGEAAKFLADHGDEEAKAILEELTNPQATAHVEEMKAAVEWHPNWYGGERGFHFDGNGGDDTPEKMLTAYRNHLRENGGR